MSGASLLTVAVVTVGILLVVADARRRPRPGEVDFGRLGRGVLVTAIVLLVLVLGADVAGWALTRALPGDSARGSIGGCAWGWWPLGMTCRESTSGADPVTIAHRPGWSPTAATVALVAASVAWGLSARRRRSNPTGGPASRPASPATAAGRIET